MSLAYSTNPFLVATDPAPIRAAVAWADSYDGAYGPVLKLSQGVPAVGPNEDYLRQHGQHAASPDNARYGDLSGEQGLRQALAKDINETYKCQGNVSAQNIAITAGCNMAAQVVIQTLAGAGDEIIVPVPYYFNHSMCLDMLGVRLQPLDCHYDTKEQAFIPSVDEARALINESTRAILLVSPNNPTGSIYSEAELDEFYELCKEKKIALILDETYRDFVPPSRGPSHNLFSKPDWQSTLISLYSFSKSYAIPGHRVGAIIASVELLEQEVSKVLDTMIICPPRAAQQTLVWAIADESQKQWRKDRAAELLGKLKLFSEVINSVNARLAEQSSFLETGAPPTWEIEGLGAYYAFLKHPYESLGMDSQEIGEIFASKVGVVCLPGDAFGQVNSAHLRVSVSNVGEEDIRRLEDRLVALDTVIRQLQE